MQGDATLRPIWHTFRVDASFDKQQGITGIGLILRATNKAGRDGAVVARFSESYIGPPSRAGEQFAVLRALEIAFEAGYRLLRVRSDYNQMRIALKDDYRTGVVQEEDNLRGMILRLARKFDQIKFAWIPRRRNQEAHFLARKAVRQSTPVLREDVERFFESGGIKNTQDPRPRV
ncbi:MAG TPA: ribonuclease H family protein [Terriglobales bacterium]